MDITEFEMLDPERVDAVPAPANGTPWLLLKSAEEPAAKFVSAAERRADAKSGVAMPDGAFPIPDEGHLRSAIGHLGGYKGDKAKAKAHIISRARALGLTHLLPEDWHVTKTIDEDTDAEKGAPSQRSAQTRARTPDPSVAEGQTDDNHPDCGPKPGDNEQPDAQATPAMSGSGDPEADGEGYGDTARTKTLPKSEAARQTREVHSKGGKHLSADADPGSPAWEHKDAALMDKAADLISQALELVREGAKREKAETSAHKATFEETEQQVIRQAADVLVELAGIDNTTTAKELDMTQDELVKLLDERDEARRAARKAKAAKKAKKAAKAKKADQVDAEVGGDAVEGAGEASKAAETAAPVFDVAEVANGVAEALKSALSPIEARLAAVEAQPAAAPLLNTAGINAALRGDTPGDADANAMKSLMDDFAKETDPQRKAELGNEISLRRLKVMERIRSGQITV